MLTLSVTKMGADSRQSQTEVISLGELLSPSGSLICKMGMIIVLILQGWNKVRNYRQWTLDEASCQYFLQVSFHDFIPWLLGGFHLFFAGWFFMISSFYIHPQVSSSHHLVLLNIFKCYSLAAGFHGQSLTGPLIEVSNRHLKYNLTQRGLPLSYSPPHPRSSYRLPSSMAIFSVWMNWNPQHLDILGLFPLLTLQKHINNY